MRPGRVAAIAVLSAALAAAAACSKAGPEERPVTLPDLSRVEPSVQKQGKEIDAALQEMRTKPGVPPAEKGQVYGTLAMLLHAGEYDEAAVAAYLNAEDLTPTDARWPYLLGHLHKSRGEPDKALTDFTRALELKPDDVPTLIRLGRLYLDCGEPAKAQPLFERAQSLRPDVVAGIVGLGQAALAQRDYARAASVLEEALRFHPTAASVHSPLAMAYRGLGDTAKAEAHLKEWKNTEVLVPDRVRQELDLLMESGLSFELRGVRALEAQDYKKAEEFFRKGIPPWRPATPSLGRLAGHKLATALGPSRATYPVRSKQFHRSGEDGAAGRARRNRRQGPLQPRRADGVGRSGARGGDAPAGGREVQPELPRGPPGVGRLRAGWARQRRRCRRTLRSFASIRAPPKPVLATPWRSSN